MNIPQRQIESVRAFNRDYTRRIGVLSKGLLDSPYTLTEVRVMYEIAHRPGVAAGQLAADLGLDRGYLSRILKGFEEQRLIERAPAAEDARRRPLRLTAPGRRVFAPLERRSQRRVRDMLAGLDAARRASLLDAMGTIRFSFTPTRAAEIGLRPHRAGDMGWVIERHGALYAREYGWNCEFEALVAGIAADFLKNLDPGRERCWIAERDGRRLGCVFLVAGEGGAAKLRLLLVEPEACGLGLGGRLIAECVRFARAAGYRRIVLWTQANLLPARRLYERAGFTCSARERHRSFGRALTAETWELELAGERHATRRPARTSKR